MQTEPILEPLKGYNEVYKDLHLKNTIEYFDELVKKSGINIDENKRTVNNYNKKVTEINKVKKKITNKKILRFFLIAVDIILVIVSIFMLLYNKSEGYYASTTSIIVWVITAIALIVSIVLIVKKINPTIKSLNTLKEKLITEAKELQNEAYKQMAPLNALYDWGMSQSLVTKTVPLIEMDKNFDPKKFQYLHEKYGFEENIALNNSTYFVQSGSILGNPFLLSKNFIQRWFNKTYTGSITIHWTTTERTKDGTRTVHHSQVLTASVSKPCPEYGFNTKLIYGNDAAPNLSFSRSPGDASGKSEGKIDKMVKKGAKRLNKKAKKDLMDDDPTTNYTRLGNDEFEVLFGAINRDNEVEFRLLYTPLAQKNVLHLIKSSEPFGDDFYQDKEKKLNTIESIHSQKFNYYASPTEYISYSYEEARKKFIYYNVNYFRSLYFDLAPLMCVPLYQQTKTIDYIYKNEYRSNITSFEQESIANSFDINLLKPKTASTPSILKCNFENKLGKTDQVKITAHAYEAHRRVSYFQKLGGDGHFHTVPVYWLEYLPCENETYMAIENKDSTRFEYNNKKKDNEFNSTISRLTNGNHTIFERGLFAALLYREISLDEVNELNKVYVGSNTVPNKEELFKGSNELFEALNKEKEVFDQIEDNMAKDESLDILNDENAETEEVASEEVGTD